MASNRDHGRKRNPKPAGDSATSPAVPVDQLAAANHPALIALVRLLAREAAAEWVAAGAEKDKRESCGEEQR